MKLHRYSHMMDYLKCPEYYNLKYIEKVEQPEIASSALDFGTCIHMGIETYLNGDDGEEVFEALWTARESKDMTYYGTHSWQFLGEVGIVMMQRFKRLHLKHFEPQYIEQQMSAEFEPGCRKGVTGTVDFLGTYKGIKSVVDWKTSAEAYTRDRLVAGPQMYGYNFMARETLKFIPEQHVYVVFCKPRQRTKMIEVAKETKISVITKKVTKSEVDSMMLEIRKLAEIIEEDRKPIKNFKSCLYKDKYRCDFWERCYGADNKSK